MIRIMVGDRVYVKGYEGYDGTYLPWHVIADDLFGESGTLLVEREDGVRLRCPLSWIELDAAWAMDRLMREVWL